MNDSKNPPPTKLYPIENSILKQYIKGAFAQLLEQNLPRSCFFYFAPAILCAQASYKHEIQPGGAACSDCDAKKGFIKKY